MALGVDDQIKVVGILRKTLRLTCGVIQARSAILANSLLFGSRQSVLPAKELAAAFFKAICQFAKLAAPVQVLPFQV